MYNLAIYQSVHHVNFIYAETRDRKHNHADRLGRKPFFTDSSVGRKQEIADSLGGSQASNITVNLGRKRKVAD